MYPKDDVSVCGVNEAVQGVPIVVRRLQIEDAAIRSTRMYIRQYLDVDRQNLLGFFRSSVKFKELR